MSKTSAAATRNRNDAKQATTPTTVKPVAVKPVAPDSDMTAMPKAVKSATLLTTFGARPGSGSGESEATAIRLGITGAVVTWKQLDSGSSREDFRKHITNRVVDALLADATADGIKLTAHGIAVASGLVPRAIGYGGRSERVRAKAQIAKVFGVANDRAALIAVLPTTAAQHVKFRAALDGAAATINSKIKK